MKLLDLGIQAGGPSTANQLASSSGADVLLVDEYASSVGHEGELTGSTARHEDASSHEYLRRSGTSNLCRQTSRKHMDYRFTA
jgi:hypothetical protein